MADQPARGGEGRGGKGGGRPSPRDLSTPPHKGVLPVVRRYTCAGAAQACGCRVRAGLWCGRPRHNDATVTGTGVVMVDSHAARLLVRLFALSCGCRIRDRQARQLYASRARRSIGAVGFAPKCTSPAAGAGATKASVCQWQCVDMCRPSERAPVCGMLKPTYRRKVGERAVCRRAPRVCRCCNAPRVVAGWSQALCPGRCQWHW